MLARAGRLSGDLDGAWREATRYLEVAGRTGSHYRQFYATRLAVDIALDRCDLAAARPLLAGLEVHAAAMDASTGLRIHADEAAARQRRAAEVAGKPAPA